ncbi:unnamed protein product [Brassicogethes aeneus]|uniref:Uncharacterized protein n=1 Tax=Brassicogethes aeneus TaxID=1431903 RepID=A0A9P0FQ46_BRAAE|nr:unnamed protein product [Brassicogethes aeneus]
MLPDVPMPPAPVLTRWGTWLEAAFFYADNFEGVKNVFETFDENSSNSIKKSPTVIQTKFTQKGFAVYKSTFQDFEGQHHKLTDCWAAFN